MLSDLQRGELIMLTALEALMNGCHRVGRFLPEVQKCRLKQQNKATHSAVCAKSSFISHAECAVSPHVA